MIALEPQSASDPPVWVVYDNGAEIHQIVNSDPGLAIGMYISSYLNLLLVPTLQTNSLKTNLFFFFFFVGNDVMNDVDFEGTFFIEDTSDDDFVGFVFG